MSTLRQDLTFAIRLLWKDRGFTATALATLALCLGANAAMFSVVRSVLLKPLPFQDAERMVYLYNSYPDAGAPRVGAAVPDYFNRRAAVPALSETALFRLEGPTYGDANGAQRLVALRATPSFYRLVRVQPVLGRLFTDDEGEPGRSDKVLLSHGFWLRTFGGDPAVLGRSIRLNGVPTDVVGVLPASFTFLENDIDIFACASFTADDREARHSNNWQMVGRLASGAGVGLVQQQVDAVNAANDARFPEFHEILKNARFHTVVVLLQDDVVRDVKRVLYLLWGAVLFVLVLGAVNIANLVMVRASGRRREMATRHAVGGDLGRLARQLLTETIVLASAGGLVGLALAWWATKSLSALNLDQLPRGYEIGLDPVSVGVVTCLTIAVGIALGVAPVVGLRHMNLNLELREGSRGGTAGRHAHRVRAALATVQVAIAFVLLVGAGLLVASFRAIMHLDYGFTPADVMTASVNLPQTFYKDNAALTAFESRALAAVGALPGVDTAGGIVGLPFGGNFNQSVILAEGYVMKPGESLLAPFQLTAAAGYFEAMRIGLVRGRYFDARDTATAPSVAIVDERLAQRFWPGRDPLGRRLYAPSDMKHISAITKDTKFFTVVGVVRNVVQADPHADAPPVGTYYFPYEQQPARGLTFTVRTRGPSGAIGSDLRRTIARLDPQLPLFKVLTMQQRIDTALSGRRVPMLIAGAFGVVALLLSAVGIYGVLAYSVVERRRELGVRMALGGSTAAIFRLVLVDGARIIGAGMGIGLVLAVGAGEVLKSQLFGVAPLDPVVLGAVTATLAVIALAATCIPALRASRIHPAIVLGA